MKSHFDVGRCSLKNNCGCRSLRHEIITVRTNRGPSLPNLCILFIIERNSNSRAYLIAVRICRTVGEGQDAFRLTIPYGFIDDVRSTAQWIRLVVVSGEVLI